MEMFQQPEAKPAPPPLPPPEATGSVEDFIPEPEAVLVVDTGDQQVQAILQAVPQADRTVVRDLVSKSTKAFVEALLSPELPPRVRYVRDLIFAQGAVTTEEVKQRYDPMAIRHVEELGLPLSRERVTSPKGRQTTLYRFAPKLFVQLREGRRNLSRQQRAEVQNRHGGRCVRCGVQGDRTLQADHRVPFELVGNSLVEQQGLDALQPLCPSCNTDKDGDCRECPNWQGTQDPATCESCYWGSPRDYQHVACKPYRRAVLIATTPQQEALLDALLPFFSVSR